MEPMTIALIASAVATAGSAYMANMSGTTARKAGEKLSREQMALEDVQRKAAFDEISKLLPPNPEDQALVLQSLKDQGLFMDPELEAAITPMVSEAGQVQVNPILREKQMAALNSLEEQSKTGLNLQDRIALEDIQSQSAAQEKSQRAAVLQNMARRGLAGSGLEMSQALIAQQEGANRQSRESLEVAAQQQQRRLQALKAMGDMAGGMEDQQFKQEMDKANARDKASNFNITNTIGWNKANTDRINLAKADKLDWQREVLRNQVNTANQQEISNKGLIQQDFENRSGIAQGKANALIGQSTVSGGRAAAASAAGQAAADRVSNQWIQGGAGASQLAGAYAAQSGAAQDRQLLRDYLTPKAKPLTDEEKEAYGTYGRQ
jgi:hypothetical protein